MGINHLELNPEIIAALYPESLVELNGPDSGTKNVKSVPRESASSPTQESASSTRESTLSSTHESLSSTRDSASTQTRESASSQTRDSASSQTRESAPSSGYLFIGKNRQSISFLTHHREPGYLPEGQLLFLGKMLSACKFSLDDISLINIAVQPFDMAELKKQLQPKIIFLWGIQPEAVGLDPAMPDFSISAFDGISIIPVPSPHLMIGDSPEGTALKQRLWTSLKKIFKL